MTPAVGAIGKVVVDEVVVCEGPPGATLPRLWGRRTAWGAAQARVPGAQPRPAPRRRG